MMHEVPKNFDIESIEWPIAGNYHFRQHLMWLYSGHITELRK